MNEPDDEEITELTELDAQKISGVRSPANGTPWLLLKSAAKPSSDADAARSSEPQTSSQEKHVVKAPKAAKKAAKRAQLQKAARQQIVSVVKSMRDKRTARIADLERAVKSAPGDAGWGYLLAKEQLSAAREDERFLQLGLAPPSQGAAIAAASAPAIQNALGPAINRPGLNPRDALISVRDSNAPSETLPGQTELPSLRINHLEKELRNAATPEARERAAYALTRARLVDGHRRGEI